MPIPVSIGYRIGNGLYVREVKTAPGEVMEITACGAQDYAKGGGPQPSDRRYRLTPDGRVTVELLTKDQAFEIMRETLIRISDQLVNKDGMTGGRCVELAAETIQRVKDGL